MESLGVLWTVLAALGVLVLPGLPAVLALRLRLLTAAAAVAPFSLLLIAIAAELGHVLGIPWTILSALVLGLLLGAVLHLTARRRPAAAAETPLDPGDRTEVQKFFARPRGRATAILAGLVVGGGVIVARALHMMGSIQAVSQTYDAVFHYNAVRHVLRSHDASAWVVGGMTALPGEGVYYPALWHQATSLAVQLAGQNDIILTSNVLMLLLGAVVWPLGLVSLVRTTTRTGPLGWWLAGGLAGITGAFPLSLMSWGLLAPYLLSIALIPVVVTAVAHLVGFAPDGPHRLRPLQLALLLPAACGAVALAHPQGVFAGIVLCVPILLWASGVRISELARRVPGALARLWPVAALTVIATTASLWLWTAARPPQSSSVWEPNATLRQAIGQVGSLAPNASPTWIPLGVVMLICLVAVLVRTDSRWMVASWLAAGGLSVATRATPTGDLRYLLTGNWYSDNYRIVAVSTVVAIPLLAVGLDALGRSLVARSPRLRTAAGPVTAGALAAALLVLSLVSPSTRVNSIYLADNWKYPVLLSDDERELLEQVPEVVPEDAVIATNAWNGSALAYAISDRPVLNTFMGFEAEPEVHLLNAKLDEARTDPEVCDAADELDVEYALDFGPQELHGRTATYTGLNEISETGAAEEVLRVGDAALLRMLPCRGTDGSMNE
ncbi:MULTISPECIES: DUF6541 family protein [unclassified Brachybacterium]|uniref:DUF6541 family protein n=1 Tax=unclassified Brachybacterium TaxID=2623841 RepID=UPI00361DE6E0